MSQVAARLPFEPIFFEWKLGANLLMEQLNTYPLLGGTSLIITDAADRLTKPLMEKLIEYSINPSPFACLILGASSFKAVAELYQAGKKEIVCLDLSEERPWEREKRLMASLQKRAEEEGRILLHETGCYLLEAVGHDLVALETELEKLICYIGLKKSLELADARAIVSVRLQATNFQLAEGFVWRGERIPAELLQDESSIFSLIGPLRYHLQLATQISSYLLSGDADWERAFPEVRPAALSKYIPICQARGILFFQKKLLKLFELEFAAKSSSTQLGILWQQWMENA